MLRVALPMQLFRKPCLIIVVAPHFPRDLRIQTDHTENFRLAKLSSYSTKLDVVSKRINMSRLLKLWRE